MVFSENVRWIFIIVAVVVFIIFLYAASVYPYGAEIPPEFKAHELPEWAKRIFTIIGIPSDWLFFPAMIYLFFIPLFGICAILIGFLSAIGIFSDRVNFVIALVIAFSLIPLGYFTRIASAMFATLGLYSVLAFGFLLFFGIAYVVFDRLYAWGFTPRRTYRGLIEEADYNRFRDWFMRTYTDNRLAAPGNPTLDHCLNHIIHDIIPHADSWWNQGRRRDAIRFLQREAHRMEREVRNAGGVVTPVPI
ncbi:MAG: hypothetical protein QXP77_00010 [Candidatus Aenigmatarchaeota archaeon]